MPKQAPDREVRQDVHSLPRSEGPLERLLGKDRDALSASGQVATIQKIDRFFDASEHIVERTSQLITKAKFVVFALGFLLFVIYELVDFARHLLSRGR
jgi:hypothetical protein